MSTTILINGLGLEMILVAQTGDDYLSYTWLLCGSLSAFFAILWISDLFHYGRSEIILMNNVEKAKRALLWLAKLVFTLFPLSVPFITEIIWLELLIILVMYLCLSSTLISTQLVIYFAVPVHALHVKHRREQLSLFHKTYNADLPTYEHYETSQR